MTKRVPLSTALARNLEEKIRSGALPPGTQLPTEADLCVEYDVSRTVVREAVARLRSAGMIVPHQGRGMFVSQAPNTGTFSITEEALRTLPETIALLELRLSVEVEAAGLCAERCTQKEAAAIRALMEHVDARNEDPTKVQIHYDYDFHLEIAKSGRNPFIHDFLAYLQPMIVPRFRLGHIVSPDLKDSYYRRIHLEHELIVEAIEQGNADAARAAMRQHLSSSLSRVRAIAQQAGFGDDDGLAARGTLNFADLLRSQG